MGHPQKSAPHIRQKQADVGHLPTHKLVGNCCGYVYAYAAMAKQIIAAALIFSASLLLLYWAAWNVSATTAPQDLRAFWAASKLAHSDPYDKGSVTSLEHAIPGYPDCEPLVMRNPPWALPFVLPMAGLEYRTAYAVSLVVNIALVLGCSIAFWHFFGGDGSLLPILLALSFGPAIWLIKMGQSSALAMLGVTLFCFALRREWYYAAGGSLLLIVIKPHLFLPMLLVVFAWTLYQRKFALLAGASVAIGAASMAAIALDRNVFSQFRTMALATAQRHAFFQSFGGWIEYVTGSSLLGLIPTGLGVGITAIWWWKRWRDYPLEELVPVLVLISVATSYYAYLYDHVLLLIPIIALLRSRYRKGGLAMVVMLNGIVWIHAIYGKRIGLPTIFPWWMGLGWLVVCSRLFVAIRPMKTVTAPPVAAGTLVETSA
jgi:hypothetical protein